MKCPQNWINIFIEFWFSPPNIEIFTSLGVNYSDQKLLRGIDCSVAGPLTFEALWYWLFYNANTIYKFINQYFTPEMFFFTPALERLLLGGCWKLTLVFWVLKGHKLWSLFHNTDSVTHLKTCRDFYITWNTIFFSSTYWNLTIQFGVTV